jgi:hypothetical protein
VCPLPIIPVYNGFCPEAIEQFGFQLLKLSMNERFMNESKFANPSRKQQRRCRRTRLNATGEVFTVAPAFVMPYMSATVAEAEKALLLMRFHVPFQADRVH